jgi:hypothetical protein
MRARALTIAALLLLAARVAFAEGEVTLVQQAVLLLKILKFDRALEKRAGDSDTATIAVIYLENDPDSEAVRAEIQTTLEAATHTVKLPVPVKIVRIPYSASRIEKDLAAANPVAAYVAPGLEAQTAALSQATRKQGALTFSSDEPSVRAGLSVGLVVRRDRPALLVNLPAAKAEGADLSSDLLRLAEVIR